MNKIQALNAAIQAAREGREDFSIFSKKNNINNINIINNSFNENIKNKNINNINSAKPEKNYKGLYAKIHSDKAFLDIQSWGVDAPFVYAAVRDHGEYTVKEIYARLVRLADSYFSPKYGPVIKQRGRLFNHEVRKLSQARALG